MIWRCPFINEHKNLHIILVGIMLIAESIVFLFKLYFGSANLPHFRWYMGKGNHLCSFNGIKQCSRNLFIKSFTLLHLPVQRLCPVNTNSSRICFYKIYRYSMIHQHFYSLYEGFRYKIPAMSCPPSP